jgi:hypothetical protein
MDPNVHCRFYAFATCSYPEHFYDKRMLIIYKCCTKHWSIFLGKAHCCDASVNKWKDHLLQPYADNICLIAGALTGRYQKVTLNNNNTNTNSSLKWELINDGVSQGSILGPLFFFFFKWYSKNNY